MRGSGRGWLRTKRGRVFFYWRNAAGRERCKVLGLATMNEAEAWIKVGELGLDKLVSQSEPTRITFGELGEKYLAKYPFNKKSSKELHEQIVHNILMPKWSEFVAIEVDPRVLKEWFLGFDVESSTRGKYKSVMSAVYTWGQCEGLLPRGEQFNPSRYVKGREFSQVTSYEPLALEPEDIFSILSELRQPEYELTLLVVACQLRISEALGLRWHDINWDREVIAIRQTFVHLNLQDGAKTKLSHTRVEVPTLVLDLLAAWRRETMYAADDDFVFPSTKLGGRQPRSGSQLVEDYLRPAAIRAGVIKVEDGVTYDREGQIVKRFGFHVLGRHSIATMLMDEQENPAVVQAIMRHAKMDMTLYYSHSRRKAKRAAQERVLQQVLHPVSPVLRPNCRTNQNSGENPVVRELVC
jgi:integrase